VLWPALRLWEGGKVTWSELNAMSVDDVFLLNEVVDAVEEARGKAQEQASAEARRKRK
jgi:hypothetical protein